MPLDLPVNPRSIQATLVQPKATHVSEFTGYTQQVSTGAQFWKGNALFPPATDADEVRRWRAFFAKLQPEISDSPDPTFWLPMISPGWNPTPDWKRLTFTSRRNFQVAADADLPAEGDLVQFSHNTIAGYNPTAIIRTAIDVLTISDVGVASFNVERSLPEGYTPRFYTAKGVKVRAVIINDDAFGANVEVGQIASPARLDWQEALGQINQELSP